MNGFMRFERTLVFLVPKLQHDLAFFKTLYNTIALIYSMSVIKRIGALQRQSRDNHGLDIL